MDKLKAIWDNASTVGRIVIVGTAVLVVLIVLGAALGDSEDGGDGDATSAATEVESGPTAEELRAAREARQERQAERRQEGERQQEESRQREQEIEQELEPSAGQRIREALGDNVSSDVAVGDSEVRSVEVNGQLAVVTLSTPEGGFEGPSTDDTDGLASAALAKVYEDGGWSGATFVEFRGGLVDSATGRELPNAPTANYRVERSAARQIDWSDEEVLFIIDWGIYRGLCHPALKGC
jgi:hypothetical protein